MNDSSFDLTRAIILNENIPSTKKLILAAIATFANKDLEAFPSYAKISKVTGYCLKTVSEVATWVKDTGFPVTITKRKNEVGSGWRHNVYLFPSADVIEQWDGGDRVYIEEDSISLSDMFQRFWSAYPRKVGKVKAQKEFSKIANEIDIEKVIADVEARKDRDPQWRDKQYIVYPERYLKYQLWEDEWDTTSGLSSEVVEFILSSGDIESIKNAGLLDEYNRRRGGRR